MTMNPAETSWRERQRLELRSLIYETALELFRSRGFTETTVQQITSVAGIGKGTFFNHFPSKDHVLQTWYRRITKTALDEVSSKKFTTGHESVLALTQRLVSDVSADPYLWDAKASATSSALLRQEEDDLDQEVYAFCQKAIEKDISEGHLAKEVNAEFLTDMVLTVLTGTAHSWTVSGHRLDLAKAIRQRISFVFEAASTDKGSK
jgi:AcrR family transcriptional regulator